MADLLSTNAAADSTSSTTDSQRMLRSEQRGGNDMSRVVSLQWSPKRCFAHWPDSP